MMLYYGDINNVMTDGVVLNLTSLNESFPRLDLVPPYTLGASSEYDFDVKYMQWIMSDDYRFAQMFQIIEDLYEGYDVYILVSNDSWSENLVESLLKLIQQRYGYNAVRVNCLEDIMYSTPSEFDRGYGLFNLDNDEDRYAYYVESHRLGGKYA